MHLAYEREKYNRGPHKINKKISISGETIIEESNDQNITILAFTFDDFGEKAS